MGAGRISRLCESGTLCPSLFAQTMYPERPYTCDAKTIIRGTEICDLLTISVRDIESTVKCAVASELTSMAILMVSFPTVLIHLR